MSIQPNIVDGVDLSALNYVPLLPNDAAAAISTGGDSVTENLNLYYNNGDIAFMIVCTALVLLMIPGVGFFYSGLVRRKNALHLIFLSMMGAAMVSFQWFFWGYTLAFSHVVKGKFIGNLDNFGFHLVLASPNVSGTPIPDLLFAIYQGMFAAITVVIALGGLAERGRLLPSLVFMFIWSTIVYDPIACWCWNPAGWLAQLGYLDFAGGSPVHIASGSAALAYSLVLGKRHGYGGRKTSYPAHNVTHIALGTVFLWVGWFGFNAGSANAANMRAVMAAVVTNLAASVGGITWGFIDYYSSGKFSMVGVCSGIVTGLVAITPGSGFVPPWAAVIYGVVGAAAAQFGTRLKFLLFETDDCLDVFTIHAIGGFVGNILTGFFAAEYIVHLDGVTTIDGGGIDGHWIQLAIQLAGSVAVMAYSFVMTAILCFLINRIPGLHLRSTDTFAEELGMDETEVGEYAYDYVSEALEVYYDNETGKIVAETKQSKLEERAAKFAADRAAAADEDSKDGDFESVDF